MTTEAARCRRCREHPALFSGRGLLCTACGLDFRDTLEWIDEIAAQPGAGHRARYLPQRDLRTPLEGDWSGWSWDGLGLDDPAGSLAGAPSTTTDTGPVAILDLRIAPPRTPLRVHVLWRPGAGPPGERDILIRGAGRDRLLTTGDFALLRRALDFFRVLSKGGAPKGPRPMTLQKRAHLLRRIPGIRRADPFISNRDLAKKLGISESALYALLAPAASLQENP